MAAPIPQSTLQLLAGFRHHLRQFLQFSEEAAARFGLQPQQHQLLLQIAGAPTGTHTTIAYAAERLGLRHNSTVELSKRCEEADLLTRTHPDRTIPGSDRRTVILALTPKGRQILEALSIDHARELNELGPQLLHTLAAICQTGKPA